ncbi:MAG: sulfatase-like hydrolase/transferase [Acidobacteriota bacterium]
MLLPACACRAISTGGQRALFLVAGLLATLACHVPGGAANDATHDDAFSVLLVTLDTTRADRLGAYGGSSSVSPAFDALARRGIIYRQATTTSPLTLPAHATLLTGEIPPIHGLRVNGQGRLAAGLPTLATRFHASGLATAAFISSEVLDRRHGLDRGFDVYDTPRDASGERRAGETVGRALAWLDSIGDRPAFLWVHLYDAHAPYRPPEPYAGLFQRRPYDGELAYADAQMGRLLHRWTARGRAGRAGGSKAGAHSVICVVGDHGEGLSAHGEREHGLLLYQSTLRVPLVMIAPGLLPGSIDTPVSIADVSATLLSLADITPDRPPGHVLPRVDRPVERAPVATGVADRTSITGDGTPARRDQTLMPRALTGVVYSESLLGLSDYGWSPLHALREGRWKLVEGTYLSLFDLAGDPEEKVDLLDGPSRDRSHPADETVAQPSTAGVAGRGQSRLPAGDDLATRTDLDRSSVAAHLSAALHRLLDRPAWPARSDGGGTMPDVVDRLRSLGYLGGTPSSAGGDPSASRPDPRDRAMFHDQVLEVLAAYRDGRMDEAAMSLAPLAAREPDNPLLQDLSGSIALAAGRPADAIQHFRASLAAGGDRPAVHARLAEALLAAGRPAAAELEARAALEGAGDRADGRTAVILCRSLHARGRNRQAAAVAQRLLATVAAGDPYRDRLIALARSDPPAAGSPSPRPAPSH